MSGFLQIKATSVGDGKAKVDVLARNGDSRASTRRFIVENWRIENDRRGVNASPDVSTTPELRQLILLAANEVNKK